MATEEKKNKEECLSTWVTDEDIANGVKDEYGVVYSKDGKRLLSCENENLKDYTVREGTEVICDGAFERCNNLTSIELPEVLISIGKYAFDGCNNLTSIELPEVLISIGKYAFDGCKNLTSIKLPDGLKSMGEDVFMYCDNLTSIELPEGLISIKSTKWSAFSGCFNLEKVYIRCSADADETAVIEKFKKLLPENLHDKIEVVRR